ncbi:MAG: FecR domain-containing protein, partial [Myxococcales bacterium]|nr:FecR domain-containing protein [Myxococcales bacterium]
AEGARAAAGTSGRRWVLAALAAAAAVVVAVIVIWRLSPPAGDGAAQGGLRLSSRALHGFRAGADRKGVGEGKLVYLGGRRMIRNKSADAELSLSRLARVRRAGADVALLAGTVVASVKRRVAAAVHFRVSGGQIEVVGTRFTVWQGEGEGSVTLHEGRVRFRAGDGRTRALAAGQTLRWPLPGAASSTASSARAAKRASSSPRSQPTTTKRIASKQAPARARARKQLESLLRRIERMRSQGRYRDAAALLGRELPRVRDHRSRERLSYELGVLLETVAASSARACAHWRRHGTRYPRGRYQREGSARLSRCAR